MLPWLMMWGPTIEILEPEWLRDTVVDNLQNSLSIYS